MSERRLYAMCSVIFSQCRDRRIGVMSMDLGALTSFDKSTFKRVLDLLEPGDLRLGQSCSSRAWSEQWK